MCGVGSRARFAGYVLLRGEHTLESLLAPHANATFTPATNFTVSDNGTLATASSSGKASQGFHANLRASLAASHDRVGALRARVIEAAGAEATLCRDDPLVPTLETVEARADGLGGTFDRQGRSGSD